MSGLPPFCAARGLRAVYCTEFHFARSLRIGDPCIRVISCWNDFAALYPVAEAAVIVSSAIACAEFADGLNELGRCHPLPVLIVATPIDAPHLLPFRRVAVDEFISLESLHSTLLAAANRAVLLNAREHLARHAERLGGAGAALRIVLARSLRQPAGIGTIQSLAEGLGITARTLENQWKAFNGKQDRMRLEDVLWVIRLLHVLELRAAGTGVDAVCHIFDVDVRSMRRASRRILGRPLGAVQTSGAVGLSVDLRNRLLAELVCDRSRNPFPNGALVEPRVSPAL